MATPGDKLKVICVDDDAAFNEIMAAHITALGYEPVMAESAEDALRALAEHAGETVMIVSDLRMPHRDGLALRAATLEKYRDIPFVILSGHVSRELALQGIELKISAFFDKPPNVPLLAKLLATDGKLRAEQIRERQILERTFIDEARQLLEELEPMVMALESSPHDESLISGIFRLVHTIKGGSGVLENDVLLRFAHKFEDLLSLYKRRERIVTPSDVTVMLHGLDALKTLLMAAETQTLGQVNLTELLATLTVKHGPSGEVAATAGEPAGKAAASKVTNALRDGIRISTHILDEFMELSGEITVFKNMVNKLVRSIEKAHPGNRDVGLLAELLDEMHKINGAMQGKIVDLRKVPLSSVLKPLPRTLRDLARDLNKPMELVTEGEELRVDTAISQALSDSLVHLVRNSADHGIEAPAVRLAAGKAARGTIKVSGREEREEVIVSIEDDGGGIDIDRVKAKILEAGSASAEVLAQMPEAKILQRIFDSGFSTATKLSDVSGRGVGMDMVRSAIERLGGGIDIETHRGKGTKFTLHMPVPKSVLIISSLLTSVAGQVFAIPQDAIVRLFHLGPEQQRELIAELPGPSRVLRVNGELFPLLSLAEILQLLPPPSVRAEDLCIVTLRCREQTFGLIVDGIIDSEEIVVKPIGAHLAPLGVYGGATFLGDGSVGLILDVEGVAKRGLITTQDATAALAKVSAQLGGLSASEYLLVNLRQPGLFAIPTAVIYRIEEWSEADLQYAGEQPVVVYRGGLMPLFALDQMLGFGVTGTLKGGGMSHIVVTQQKGRFFGFAVSQVIDIASSESELQPALVDRVGLTGNVFFGERAGNVVDLNALLRRGGFLSSDEKAALPAAAAVEAQAEATPPAEGWGVF